MAYLCRLVPSVSMYAGSTTEGGWQAHSYRLASACLGLLRFASLPCLA